MSDTTAPPVHAGWFARVAAHLIDVVPLIALFIVMAAMSDGIRSSTDDGFSLSINLDGVPAAVYLVITLGWFGYNWLHLEGGTGQTVGKKALGISLVSAETRRPLGAGLVLARQFVHILDSLPCLLGWLWPIWDREKRTFADMTLGTRVVKV